MDKLYSDKVLDHFHSPRNMGELDSPDGVARVGNPVCGDVMEMQLKVGVRSSASSHSGLDPESVDSDVRQNDGEVKEEYIEDIKFKTLGCGAAIATSSIATEMVKGKSLEEAKQISNKAVTDTLGGLPPAKQHCSVLAADAIKKAIADYRSKQ